MQGRIDWDAVKASGLVSGVMLKTALTGKTFELPISVDVEDNKFEKLGKQALTDLTAYALATIEQWGFYALFYTGLDFGETRLYMGGAALKPYDGWQHTAAKSPHTRLSKAGIEKSSSSLARSPGWNVMYTSI